MTQTIVDFFQSVTGNNYLTLFLVSIIPIIELRGAIILIAGMPDVHRIAGMFVSLAGSSVVIIPLLLCLRPILNKLKKTKLFGKIAAFFQIRHPKLVSTAQKHCTPKSKPQMTSISYFIAALILLATLSLPRISRITTISAP